ncbi:MAG: hypothetical protein MHM6MM_007461 [Cercozoa sp. M6MM]
MNADFATEMANINLEIGTFSVLQQLGVMPANEQQRPLWQNLLAGGGAGVAEICAMYPTDVVKTQLQLHHGKASMISVAQSVRQQRGLRGFYRGIGAPIAAEGPKRAVKFTMNERYKTLFINTFGKEHAMAAAFAAGASAGVTEALINCPFEVVKVRMQAATSTYASSTECVKGLIRSEGLPGLWRGLEAQCFRNGSWNGLYFGIIGTVRSMLHGDESLAKKFASGVVGGIAATSVATPFDVVKSRVQNLVPAEATQAQLRELRGTSLHVLARIARTEGWGALYKGYGARVLRLGPGGGIMLLGFDMINKWIDAARARN